MIASLTCSSRALFLPQVSGFFQQHFPKRLFQDRRFASHPCEAMCDALVALEDLLVRGGTIGTAKSCPLSLSPPPPPPGPVATFPYPWRCTRRV